MKGLKSRLPALIDRADKLSDSVRLRLRKTTGFSNPLTIIPYLGYGTADKLLFAGRVLEDEKFTPASSADRTWRNLINMYKRFETDEVPGARIRARFQGSESEAITDEEGYFSFEIQPVGRLDSNQWQQVELDLLDPPPLAEHPVRATARVLVPPATARFGIISDIDDTVISTHVGNKLNRGDSCSSVSQQRRVLSRQHPLMMSDCPTNRTWSVEFFLTVSAKFRRGTIN